MSRRSEASSHDHPLRVRYAETDQMGVAYHANYLVWFEVGRTEYCRARGFSYERLERQTGTFLVVVEASCRYRIPLRYDDRFVVRTFLSRPGRRLLTFSYLLLRPDSGEIHAEGETKHAVTGIDGRVKSFPPDYFRLLVEKGSGGDA